MKFRKRPIIIEAEPYQEGIEDGWEVLFSGNFYDYNHSFKQEQDAQYFINNNLGINEVYLEDKDYEIIYEIPIPYINTLEGKHYITEGDYIITGVKGERYPCKKDIFIMTYELVK